MAGLIPQTFIDDLLDRVDIVDVVNSRVQLKKAGKNYKACCPFHEEKSPSFTVAQDKQFYYCFGCGAGGNSVGFIMDYENIDFPAAVETLAAMVGLEVPREETGGNSELQRKRKSQSQSLYDVLGWTAHHFQTQLRQHSNKKQAIESGFTELKAAHAERNIAGIDSAMERLNAAWQAASQEMYNAANAEGANPAGDAGAQEGSASENPQDEVTDVDFEEVSDKK